MTLDRWRRGLLRLWLVVSAAWVLSIGALAVALGDYQELPEKAGILLAMMFAPVAAIFAVGAGLLWAFAGFSRTGDRR